MNGDCGTTAARDRAAEQVRRRMWGNNHTDRIALLRKFEPQLADLVVREVFGGIYPDDRLSLEQRSLCTISTLVTQGKTKQLASHIEAALRLGIPRSAISALMAHLFVYVGLPTTLEGLRVLDEVAGGVEVDPEGADR